MLLWSQSDKSHLLILFVSVSVSDQRLAPSRLFKAEAIIPLYYLDFHDGYRHCFDDDGQEFPDINKARDEAISTLLDVVRDVRPAGDRRDCITNVAEESGKIVFRARLSLTPEWPT